MRLRRVNDTQASNGPLDMGPQPVDNYTCYDNGHLKSDSADFIRKIHWNVANKIDRIVFMADSSKPDQIIFRHDAMGERALKLVQPDLSDTTTWTWTYYVRDAQGNVLTTYQRAYFDPVGTAEPVNLPAALQSKWDSLGTLTYLKASEYHLYGSDRIGIYSPELFVAFHDNDTSLIPMLYGYDPYAYDGDPCGCDTTSTCSSPPCDPCWCRDNDPCGCPPCLNCDDCYCTGWPTTDFSFSSASHQVRAFVRGKKRYELKNHLGNVLSVISDRKLQYAEDSLTVEYYNPDIWAWHDYNPFGTHQQARTWEAANYRYGFQGQEADDELFGEDNAINYTFRMYDARIGRFLSIDPLAGKYPWYSPYAFSGNKVIAYRELEGLEEMGATRMVDYFSKRLPSMSHEEVKQNTIGGLLFLGGGLAIVGTGGAILRFGPQLISYAISNPYTSMEFALEIFNPSAVGAYGVGGAGLGAMFDDLYRSGRPLLFSLWEESVDQSSDVARKMTNYVELPEQKVDQISEEYYFGKLVNSADDAVNGLGTYSYRTKSGMLDIHSHGEVGELEGVNGLFYGSLGIIDDIYHAGDINCVNIFACNSSSLAPWVAQGSGKYVGGMTTKFSVFDDGTISLLENGAWQIFNPSGELIGEIDSPGSLSEIVEETARIINDQ